MKGERYLVAELKCYSCGHVAGYLSGPIDAPLAGGRFRPAGSDPATAPWRRVRREHLACPRCAGRVLLDDIEYCRARAGEVLPWHQPTPAPAAPKRADHAA